MTIVQFADGNGYVGGIDLRPGAYRLYIPTQAGDQRVTIPQPVVPGRVTRVTVDLRPSGPGPEGARGTRARRPRAHRTTSGTRRRRSRNGRAASRAPEDIPPNE